MKKLFILLGSAALLAGCQSSPNYSGNPGKMSGNQAGTISDTGYNPAAATTARSSASGAIGAGAGATGTRLGTGP